MNPSEILGLALHSYYQGNEAAVIVVHSADFDPDEQTVSYYFRGFDAMPEIECEAINLSRGKILDIGAAAGSHCLELQKRGFDVTALELSSEACAIMKKRGVMKVLNADILNPSIEKYDTLLMLMNGIGLVQTLEGLSKFLKHIKSYMNPGAQLIFDSANLIYLFQDEDSDEAMIDLNSRYYGEIDYEMEFEDVKSDQYS